jgi:hypothetical protein
MEVEIGHVTHFFNKINVAVLSIKNELKVGDMIHTLFLRNGSAILFDNARAGGF